MEPPAHDTPTTHAHPRPTAPHDHTPAPAPAPTHTPNPNAFNPRDAAGLLARGLAMGAADVVPGVSGGTIAFITGIYERFIEALRSLSPAPLLELLRGRPRAAWIAATRIHWGLLIPLGIGIAIAIVGFSKLILRAMDTQPGPTYAVFFGLIAASAWMPFAKMRQRRPRHALAGVAAAVAAFLFVGLRPDGVALRLVDQHPDATAAIYAGTLRSPADLTNALALLPQPIPIAVLDRKGVLDNGLPDGIPPERVIIFTNSQDMHAWHLNQPRLTVLAERRANLPWIFACGGLAISAMVLPGVSGSFLLLFLGQYHAVFGALHALVAHATALIRGQPPDPLAALAGTTLLGDALFLAAFLSGVVLGVALFARVVSWLFHRVHDLTMAALTGLMVGALRVPWDEMARDASSGRSWLWIALAALAGVAIVAALALVERRMPKHATTNPTPSATNQPSG